MKNSFNPPMWLMLLIAFAAGCLSSDAQCSIVVDKFCSAFNNMTVQVERISDMEQLDALNFDEVVNEAIDKEALDSIPDECYNYVLTNADKAKLSRSIDDFVDALVNKMYTLVGSVLSKQDIEKNFSQMRLLFKKAIDSSRTFNDMCINLAKVEI